MRIGEHRGGWHPDIGRRLVREDVVVHAHGLRVAAVRGGCGGRVEHLPPLFQLAVLAGPGGGCEEENRGQAAHDGEGDV